jgi:hypothetical protein
MKNASGFKREKIELLEDTAEESKRREDRFPTNRIKGIIYCPFCDSLATLLAIREDGKITPCCTKCISFIKDKSWLKELIQR